MSGTLNSANIYKNSKTLETSTANQTSNHSSARFPEQVRTIHTAEKSTESPVDIQATFDPSFKIKIFPNNDLGRKKNSLIQIAN